MAQHVANRGRGVIMQQSALLNNLPDEWDDLSANVSIGFPILGIKGGKWHYRFRGEEQIIMDATGRFPTPNLQIVIIKAQKELSRTFYQYGYEEGKNAPPDCWSSDGVRPDETVQSPVNPVCATCPMDAWGSGATAAAPKSKACSQRRRMVVTPVSDDLTNENGGGPILLSVPPGSLANLVGYSNKLKDARVSYVGCVTEVSFSHDPNIAFPKIEFEYVRPLDDDEVRVVLDLRGHEQVDRILATKMQPAELEAPEVAPDGEQGYAAPQRPTGRAAPQTSAVRPPPRQPPQTPPATQAPVADTSPVQRAQAPRQAAPPPPPPPPRQAAPPPPPPPPPAPTQAAPRVGGFPLQSIRGAPQTDAGQINSAIQAPAQRPTTLRTVATAPAPAPEPAPAPQEYDGPAEEQGEPESTEGYMPSEMGELFSSIMGTK